MVIRRFETKDAEEVSALIVRTLREVNIKDYSSAYIEDLILRMQPSDIMKRASATHFYVVCEADNIIERADRIIGCGAIGPYWDKADESALFNIFILPEYLGKGIGRMIMETLENDEYFLRAKRVEIPASITAVSFYLGLGYTYKEGGDTLDDEGLYRLEKNK